MQCAKTKTLTQGKPAKKAKKMREPKHHHSDRDRIFTPEDLAIKMIAKIPALPQDSWCDPCFGTGVFFNNFPSINKEYFEIDLGNPSVNICSKCLKNKR